MDLKSRICKDLQIPETLFDSSVSNARRAVYQFKIPKKNGDERTIYQAAAKTKTIQYWLLKNIFEKVKSHPSSMAFSQGCSILKNAEHHQNNRFFLKIDLLNFFPSVTFEDVKGALIKNWEQIDSLPPDKDLFELIRTVCFFKGDILPIGYPTSPILSNIAMLNFDEMVMSTLESSFGGDVTYTRYADDMVFSTNVPGRTHEVFKLIRQLITTNTSPKISINPDKTTSGSSSGGSAIVTGIKICPNHLTITKKQKDEIRLLLSLYSKGRLCSSDYERTIGLISFARNVDPSFFTRVSERFFREIRAIKKELAEA